MGATTVLAAGGVCPPGPLFDGWVAVADGLIVDVGRDRAPRGAVDLGDSLLVPGFVDLQANGVGAVDFATASPEEWRRARGTLAAHGVTSFCPTFVSGPLEGYEAILEQAHKARDDCDGPGASVLGVHLEGPFLGGAPGAHAPEHVVPVDLDWIAALLDRFGDLVRIVTLAPEADPGLRATRLLALAGVVVALGHSTATYDEAIAAADAGARVVTHLFNGMATLHHREPGVAGAALDDDRLVPTMIADLVHVHPSALRLAFARAARVALVSDVVAVDEELALDSGAARRGDGTLVGATSLLDESVANVIAAGVVTERAIASVTEVPADVLGLSDRGRLREGARADLVALDPSTRRVRGTWLAGTPV